MYGWRMYRKLKQVKPIAVTKITINKSTVSLKCRYANVSVDRTIMIPDYLKDHDMLRGMVKSDPALLLDWVTSDTRVKFYWVKTKMGPGLMEFLKTGNTIPFNATTTPSIDQMTDAIEKIWYGKVLSSGSESFKK